MMRVPGLIVYHNYFQGKKASVTYLPPSQVHKTAFYVPVIERVIYFCFIIFAPNVQKLYFVLKQNMKSIE